MNINEFFASYKNHPILFIGSGFSLRYLENSFNWRDLLEKIGVDLYENEEPYLDLVAECTQDDECNLPLLAFKLEQEFNKISASERHGKFKSINDEFYENSKKSISLSRFKIYVSKLLSDLNLKKNIEEEINELKNTAKNLSAIITTNYDKLCEEIFKFKPLVGNNILLSNPYGSIYKIHGCVDEISKIIITSEDYQKFEVKYELIRAQLLSLFIHNPIIFIGYRVGDENIQKILSTIFSYVDPKSPEADRIKSNFLLVERGSGADSDLILDHDIVIENTRTIRINKIKTNNFLSVYKGISNLELPVSALDIRKVQSVFKEIITQGDIKVSIADDIDSINNNEKILVVGSINNVKYEFHNNVDLINNYFNIISNKQKEILPVIDKLSIHSNHWFPIYGFGKLNNKISKEHSLKNNQDKKIKERISSIKKSAKVKFTDIDKIISSQKIPASNKIDCIIYNFSDGRIDIDSLERYLKSQKNKSDSSYRCLLCFFDQKKYKSKVLPLPNIQSTVPAKN